LLSFGASFEPLILGCVTEGATGLLRLPKRSFAGLDSLLGLLKRLVVAGCCAELPKKLLGAGLLRFAKTLLDADSEFFSPNKLCVAGAWLLALNILLGVASVFFSVKRLEVLGVALFCPNISFVVFAGVGFWLPKRLLVGAALSIGFPNRLFVDGAGEFKFENKEVVGAWLVDVKRFVGWGLSEALVVPKRLVVGV
jgi:hypothetical protein